MDRDSQLAYDGPVWSRPIENQSFAGPAARPILLDEPLTTSNGRNPCGCVRRRRFLLGKESNSSIKKMAAGAFCTRFVESPLYHRSEQVAKVALTTLSPAILQA